MTEEFDVIVIGAGPGGYVAAIRAAQLGLNVACIEKDAKLGGTCLNIGCIPSKCLLQSSEMYANLIHNGKTHGIEANPKIDFSKMMKRKEEVISGFNMGIEGLFKKNKVSTIRRGKIIGGKIWKYLLKHQYISSGQILVKVY